MSANKRRICEWVRERYIAPAKEGDVVCVPVNDVMNGMELGSRMSAVCNAVGSEYFESLCGVRRVACTGSCQHADCVMVFRILPANGSVAPASGKATR
jgi:hypothetical protein